MYKRINYNKLAKVLAVVLCFTTMFTYTMISTNAWAKETTKETVPVVQCSDETAATVSEQADVTYKANGGYGDDFTTEKYEVGSSVKVLGNLTENNENREAPSFTRNGYTFKGWSTDNQASKAEYNAGENLTMVSDGITLYAVWSKNTAVVSKTGNTARFINKNSSKKLKTYSSFETLGSGNGSTLTTQGTNGKNYVDLGTAVSAVSSDITSYSFNDCKVYLSGDDFTVKGCEQIVLSVSGDKSDKSRYNIDLGENTAEYTLSKSNSDTGCELTITLTDKSLKADDIAKIIKNAKFQVPNGSKGTMKANIGLSGYRADGWVYIDGSFFCTAKNLMNASTAINTIPEGARLAEPMTAAQWDYAKIAGGSTGAFIGAVYTPETDGWVWKSSGSYLDPDIASIIPAAIYSANGNILTVNSIGEFLAVPLSSSLMYYTVYEKDGSLTTDTISATVNYNAETVTPVDPAPVTGTVTVTKSTLTQTGKTANVSSTFYFTLFSDEACTKAVTKPQAVTVTNGASSSTTFTNVAQGTYYLAETNVDGTKVISTPADTDDYTGYGVEGNIAKITISANSPTGSAAIINRYTAKSSKTPTTPKKPTTPKTPALPVQVADKSAQTGDGSNAGLWTLLMIIGAAGCTACTVLRRKERSEE
ncbi:MAG: InlB B-repeat-containing protein [Eubacteriaceae bacterium]|nr:InlB B-repeat-containing protein [Eubacteriaceae bacterium]